MSKLHPKAGPEASSEASLVEKVARLVTQITGVRLDHQNLTMLEARIRHRMNECGLSDAQQYLAFIQQNWDSEVPALVSLLTTHHSYFFREFAHFEFLEKTALPRLAEALRKEKRTKLRLWAAACSRGQEVYSLSMFLHRHLTRMAPGTSFEILGTDVDAESVALARNGVYRWSELKSVPAHYSEGHWVRGEGEIADFVKAKDSIRRPCQFQVMNLLNLDPAWPEAAFDVIFCRNVLMYFHRDQMKQVGTRLLECLAPHGFLFIGKSESLGGLSFSVDSPSHSIYVRSDGRQPAKAELPATPNPGEKSNIRVLCVDDSPTILALFKNMLTAAEGFQIVGTAKNGREAAEQVKKLKPDVVTLDIHMPEQGGVEYLRENMSPSHPPVVVISSIAREDIPFALATLELGASDYVEKPTLSRFAEKAEEVRTKIRTALSSSQWRTSPPALDKSFASPQRISAPEKCLRLIVCNLGDREKLGAITKDFRATEEPPTLVLVYGTTAELLPAVCKTAGPRAVIWNGEGWVTGGVYVAGFDTAFDNVRREAADRKVVLVVLGAPPSEVVYRVGMWAGARFLLEDTGTGKVGPALQRLHKLAAWVVPYTSLAYHSAQVLADAEKEGGHDEKT